MIADRDIVEDGLCQDLESLSVSRKLVRSVSQKLRKKRIHRSAGDEEETANGFSLRCLTLYGRGGGCKVGADTSEEFGDSSNRRRSSASEEGKGFKPICGAEETGVDCFRMEGRIVFGSEMRSEGLYQTPWLFVFGAVKEGYCTGEIHVLDVSLNQWHNINAEVLRGRFMYSVASMRDEIFIVGGCSSLTSFGRVDRSSFKTHKIVHSQSNRQDRRFPRSRLGGVSDVYEDPHRLSVRRQLRNLPLRHRSETSSLRDKRFVLIAIGGLGSWDEPLDSGELYDSVSNKWIEIPKLPVDFGIVCSGVVCNGTFFVYSESDKLAGYDPFVHAFCSWCEGDGQIGRRNKAIRKMWELDLVYLAWIEVSVHPDAPMDWNAAFVADKNLIFGVEMFKIFGQVLDFFTICNVSDKVMKWSHISRNRVALELDASSCVTKTIMAIHL
uniref:Uncharacterized protein n=1 Tax=Chenopodium quinoa TaxID=63459 RepID=A0A803N9E5_CHEQI